MKTDHCKYLYKHMYKAIFKLSYIYNDNVSFLKQNTYS